MSACLSGSQLPGEGCHEQWESARYRPSTNHTGLREYYSFVFVRLSVRSFYLISSLFTWTYPPVCVSDSPGSVLLCCRPAFDLPPAAVPRPVPHPACGWRRPSTGRTTGCKWRRNLHLQHWSLALYFLLQKNHQRYVFFLFIGHSRGSGVKYGNPMQHYVDSKYQLPLTGQPSILCQWQGCQSVSCKKWFWVTSGRKTTWCCFRFTPHHAGGLSWKHVKGVTKNALIYFGKSYKTTLSLYVKSNINF